MADIFSRVPLTALKVFVVACRHQTFTAAGLELAITQAAVSRQIAQLEHLLAIRLFARRDRQVHLTEDGKRLAEKLAPHFVGLADDLCDYLEERRNQLVSINVYPTFADRWLLPRLKTFETANPGLRIKLSTNVAPINFRQPGIDLAIQLGDKEGWPDSHSRVLFADRIEPVCSPVYFREVAAGDPNRLLAHARRLMPRYRRLDWMKWEEATGMHFTTVDSMVFESSILAYRAAQCGLGLVMGQLALLDDALAAGLLVRPFEHAIDPDRSFRVAWPGNVSVHLKTRKIVDWLLECCGQEAEFGRA